MTRTSVHTADVVVVGGGPAGIAASTRAAETGARVIIIDSGMRPGGQIWRHADVSTLPHAACRWIERSQRAGVRWMLQSTVVDGSLAQGLAVIHGDEAHIVRAPRIVIAAGARELFLPYPGWTLPNAMGVGGAQALLKGGLDVRGKRAIVAGSGPLLLPVAAALTQAGARVDHVIEQAPMTALARFAASLLRSYPEKLVLAARYRSKLALRAYRTATWVTRADGDRRVESVTLTDGRRHWSEPCDLLCCSHGLVPNTELARILGCVVRDGKVVVDARQQTTIAGIYCAGEGTGVAGDAASIAEGEVAGLVAARGEAQVPAALLRRRDRGRRFQHSLATAFQPRAELMRLAEPQTVICRCEDVRFGRLDREWTGRQAKLYTRIGMGACQGAVCGPAAEHLFGWLPGSVRPPLFGPVLETWAATLSSSSTIDEGVRPSP